jgi:protein-tyrosine kinase
MTEQEEQMLAGVRLHPGAANRVSRETEIEMLRLHQCVETLLPNRPSKVIQFIGPSGGVGVSAIVNVFGDVVARRVGKRVLSVDVVEMERGWNALALEMERHPGVASPMVAGNGRIAEGFRNRQIMANVIGLPTQAQFPGLAGSPAGTLFQRRSLSAHWSRLSAATDLILLDTPPAAASATGLAVAPTADGVILVIEAGVSGHADVVRAKEDIERAGGHLLGCVLNKRRSYLPRFIERWV